LDEVPVIETKEAPVLKANFVLEDPPILDEGLIGVEIKPPTTPQPRNWANQSYWWRNPRFPCTNHIKLRLEVRFTNAGPVLRRCRLI